MTSRAAIASGSDAPATIELDPALQPEAAFAALAGERHVAFFDSAMRHPSLGRYSYVAVDPFDWLTVAADGSPALPRLRDLMAPYTAEPVPGLPPWQGGAAGVIAYEVGRSLERLPRPAWDEFETPAVAIGLYDVVIAFDHAEQRCWAISQGLPESGDARRRRADERLDWLLARLDDPRSGERPPRSPALVEADLAPCYPTPCGVVSDFTRDGYLRAVERVVEHLRAGDAFQVNLSQRLLAPDPGDPVAMYLRLRDGNAAPFGGYFDAGDWQLASASPERFLRLDADGSVETRPIKGTRPLTPGAADELVASEKDRAENVMIVDLLRNDLARVCRDESVTVPTLFGLEQYAHVHHLTSVVVGQLREGADPIDLLAATLPGGSITGAPKVSAQQIIARLEPTARGPYCGALLWLGFAGADGRQAMDSSVLIRTLTRSRGWVQAPVGGGVVVRSDPAAEYEETWHKAAGLIDAVAP